MERCLAEQKSRFQNDLQDSLRDEEFRALLKQELWNREYDGDDDYDAEAGEPPRKRPRPRRPTKVRDPQLEVSQPYCQLARAS